jgi:hypothetical protein
MEYKIYKKIRKYKIPLFLRVIITICLIIVWLSLVIFPFPGSAIVWWSIVILSFIFIIEARDIKELVKIRKWIIHYLKNIHIKQTRIQKVNDIKKHIKEILNSKK